MGNMTPEKIRILCVDDSPEARRLFELVLQDDSEFLIVGSLPGAETLEASIGSLSPDVVAMDLAMPGRSPLKAMQSALEQFPDVRFLISSAYDDPAGVEKAFAAGASGYVVKDGILHDLVEALRKVANGGTVVPRRGLRRADQIH